MKKGLFNTILFALIAIPIRVNPTATPTPIPTTPLRQIERVSTPTPTQVPQRILERVIDENSPTPTQTLRVMPTVTRTSPTPTPTMTPLPLRKTIEFNLRENKFLLDGKEDESTRSSIDITIASSSAILTKNKDFTNFSFEIDNKKIDLPIRSDFIIKDDKFFLIDNGRQLPLKFSPRSFYIATQNVLERTKGKLRTIELATENNKPIYTLRIKNKLKLLGIIPFNNETKLVINGETNAIEKIDTSLLSKFASKIDWAEVFAAGPNLEIKNVKFEPLSFKEGNQVVIRADLYNKGTEKAYALNGSHVKNWLYFKDKQIYGTDEVVIDIDPGQSQKLVYVWDKVVCNAPISLIFDPDRVLKEENSQTTWYGTTFCAPDNGPDLTVTQITFEGLSYGGKNPGVSNKVNYVIRNIGNAPSGAVQALAKAGNSQFLAIISVPYLKSGGSYGDSYSGSFNYTPVNCDPVEIIVDGQKYLGNTETNLDNNDIFEDKQITDWCNNYPQLQFDRVYWMVNGYSFGKSKYPNGSYMNFEVDVGNLSWNATVGCAALVKIRVEMNGQFYPDIPVGTVGNCANGGVHNIGDNAHMFKTVKFNLGPACGAEIKFNIDPDKVNSEINRSDNTWTHKVECE